MIYGSSGLEKYLLSYSNSKLIKTKRFKNADSAVLKYLWICTDWSDQFGSVASFNQFYEFFLRVTSVFWMQANNFLEFFPFSGIPVFEVAILAYKKVRIFEMLPIQCLVYKIKASICTKFQAFITFSTIFKCIRDTVNCRVAHKFYADDFITKAWPKP